MHPILRMRRIKGGLIKTKFQMIPIKITKLQQLQMESEFLKVLKSYLLEVLLIKKNMNTQMKN